MLCISSHIYFLNSIHVAYIDISSICVYCICSLLLLYLYSMNPLYIYSKYTVYLYIYMPCICSFILYVCNMCYTKNFLLITYSLYVCNMYYIYYIKYNTQLVDIIYCHTVYIVIPSVMYPGELYIIQQSISFLDVCIAFLHIILSCFLTSCSLSIDYDIFDSRL